MGGKEEEEGWERRKDGREGGRRGRVGEEEEIPIISNIKNNTHTYIHTYVHTLIHTQLLFNTN